MKRHTWLRAALFATAILMFIGFAGANGNAQAVMWEEVDIKNRNLFLGPGGTSMKPKLSKITFIKRDTGGNNRKYRIKDAAGREWVAKIADESQAEVAAVRLLWGIGYKTEVNYFARKLNIPGQGRFENVSLEARPADVERGERWSWKENPFVGSKEFQGLKIMMALINNWDLKDDNNAIFIANGEHQYVISDLGSSFGKLSPTSLPILNRVGRSVNKPEHYARDSFIKGLNKDGYIDFAYDGKGDFLLKEITPADAKWLARLLSQLSYRQISDAFRAAGYSRSEIQLLASAVRNRVAQLNAPHREYGSEELARTGSINSTVAVAAR